MVKDGEGVYGIIIINIILYHIRSLCFSSDNPG